MVNKISISKVLKETFKLYIKNFLPLTALSSVSILVPMNMLANEFFTRGKPPALPLQILFYTAQILILGVLLILMPRVTLGIQFFVAGVLDGNRPSLREACAKASGRVLRLIGNSLLAGLFGLAVFAILTGIVMRAVPPSPLFSFTYSVLFAVSATLIRLFLGLLAISAFSLLVPTVAFEDSREKTLRRAVSYVKGNYWRIVVIVFVTNYVLLLPGYLLSATVFRNNPSAAFVLSLVAYALMVITLALSSVAMVIVYRQLVTTSSEPTEQDSHTPQESAIEMPDQSGAHAGVSPNNFMQ